jgi:hypothetical protein
MYTAIPTTPPCTPPSASSTSSSHSRTPSIALSLPVYSSNRFKRKFKGVLWVVVTVLVISWMGFERSRRGTELQEQEAFVEERSFASLNRSRFFGDNSNRQHEGKVLLSMISTASTKQETELLETSEDVEGGNHETLSSLPFCSKTFLFRFAGKHSESSSHSPTSQLLTPARQPRSPRSRIRVEFTVTTLDSCDTLQLYSPSRLLLLELRSFHFLFPTTTTDPAFKVP